MNGDDPNDIFYKGMWLNIYPTWMFYEALALFQQYTRVHGYPNTVIDVGAHQGSMGLVAAHHGAERVIMVDPVHVEQLKRNVECSGHSDVVELIEGVVAPGETAIIEWMDCGGMQSILYDPEAKKKRALVRDVPGKQVKCFNLVDIIRSFERVDLLKIDVESAEFTFFGESTPGLRDALDLVDYVSMEFHTLVKYWYRADDPMVLPEYRVGGQEGADAMIEFARSCGFKVYDLEPAGGRYCAFDRKVG